MPRQVAFLLCSAFVFYVLRYDRRKSTDVSAVLWLPTIWMLLVASRTIDDWLGVEGGSRESGGVFAPVLDSALLCLGLMILAKRRFNWSAVIRENVWLVMLVGYMLVSVIWSDVPFISFKRWTREFLALIMAFLVLSDPAPRQAIESLLRRPVYILIPFSLFLIKYRQDMGVEYDVWTGDIQWIGVTLQKNSLGRLCLISTFFLVWTLIRRWQKTDVAVGKHQTGAEVILLIMTLWLLRGPSMWAASATAIYSLSAGFITFFALSWMRKHRTQLGVRTWVMIIACIIAFGTITPFVGGSTIMGFTSAVGRDSTLTGRTDIWAGLLPDVMRQPLLGHGFGGFWTSEIIAKHRITESHNGYLGVLLQLGAIGLMLTAVFLLSSVRKAVTLMSRNHDWATVCICFLVMAAIHNITESSFDSFSRQLPAIVLFLSVTAPLITRTGLPTVTAVPQQVESVNRMQLAAGRPKLRDEHL